MSERKTARQKVEESLEVAAEVCTEWECDFLESVNEQMARRRDMSPKQLDIIDRIYDKVCRSNY